MADQACPGHEKHICALAGQKKWDEVKKLVQNARYICKNCGRAAASGDNLCKPEKI